MTRSAAVLVALGLVAVPGSAWAGDLSLQVFDHQLGASPRPTATVSFPDYDQDYSEVILTLESFNPCEVGVDGDEWDRTAYVYIQDDHDELIQIARWLTPYWNLPFVWTLDISEMQSSFHGDRKIFVDVGGRHQYSLTLDLTYGTPARLPVRATTMWRGHPGVAAVDAFFSPLTLPVHEEVDYVDMRMNFSSHGGDGPIEFGPAQWAQIGVNGEIRDEWYHYFNRGADDLSDGFDCPDNPTGPQGTCADTQPACAVDDEQAGGGCVTGNWGGVRINWCPGELIPSWIVDVSDAVEPGELAAVDVGYADVAIAGAGSLRVDSQWIESRASDSMLVAPLYDWAPRRFASEELSGSGSSYWIKNLGTDAIEWAASASVEWLNPSPSSGSLEPGEAVEVSVAFNDATDALALGEHLAMVSFEDTSSGIVEQRSVALALEARGVLGYWPIVASSADNDEGARVLELSGQGLDGSLLDESGPRRDEGRFGAGLPLGAGAERVEIPGAIVRGHQRSSYALWFRTSSTATQMFVSGGADGETGDLRLFMAGDGTELRFNAHSHTATWSGLELADGDWHHVVATLDGATDTFTMYLDGVALDSQALAWAGRLDLREEGLATLGAQLDSETVVVESSTFEGSLDDLRIYNDVLTPDEVAALYLGGPAMMPSPFDDERNVDPSRELSWVPGASASAHRLYLGTDLDAVRDADEGSVLYMGELDSPAYVPEDMDRRQYYWRVDEVTEAGVITGPVWRFDTYALEGEAEAESDAGCGCSTQPRGSGPPGYALALLVWVGWRGRRARLRGASS